MSERTFELRWKLLVDRMAAERMSDDPERDQFGRKGLQLMAGVEREIRHPRWVSGDVALEIEVGHGLDIDPDGGCSAGIEKLTSLPAGRYYLVKGEGR